MNFRNRFGRVVCGVGLALAFTVAPAISAAPIVASAAQSGAMSRQGQVGRQVDINTATESQLRNLPGIGSTYARRIITGRPYRTKNQLVSKGILPQGVYDKIKDMIVAQQGRR